MKKVLQDPCKRPTQVAMQIPYMQMPSVCDYDHWAFQRWYQFRNTVCKIGKLVSDRSFPHFTYLHHFNCRDLMQQMYHMKHLEVEDRWRVGRLSLLLRYPMSRSHQLWILKYWFRLWQTHSIILLLRYFVYRSTYCIYIDQLLYE
jgi:hypothetical protein